MHCWDSQSALRPLPAHSCQVVVVFFYYSPRCFNDVEALVITGPWSPSLAKTPKRWKRRNFPLRPPTARLLLPAATDLFITGSLHHRRAGPPSLCQLCLIHSLLLLCLLVEKTGWESFIYFLMPGFKLILFLSWLLYMDINFHKHSDGNDLKII